MSLWSGWSARFDALVDRDPWLVVIAILVALVLFAWATGCAPAAPRYPGCPSEPGAYLPAVPDWRGGWRDCS